MVYIYETKVETHGLKIVLLYDPSPGVAAWLVPIVGATGHWLPLVHKVPTRRVLVVADVHRVLWSGRCSHTLDLLNDERTSHEVAHH